MEILELMQTHLGTVSLLGQPAPALAVVLLLGIDLTLSLVHVIQEFQGRLWRYFGAIAGIRIPDVLLPEAAPSGYPDLTRWEGLLAPDTYEFRQDAGAVEILSRLADTLVSRLDAQDWTLFEEAELTPYQGLIVASLIEREAKLDEDRPLIASVIMNRLDAGIGLQIDATVIYALGENRSQVLLEDLEVDSPYNTYKWAGLPPTPISGVRLASLEAAAEPTETDFYYYVLIDAEGKHGFSETLEEHNRKKQEARDAGIIP